MDKKLEAQAETQNINLYFWVYHGGWNNKHGNVWFCQPDYR